MSRSHRNNLQQLNGPGFVENRFAASLRMSGDTPDGFIREDSGAPVQRSSTPVRGQRTPKFPEEQIPSLDRLLGT